MRTTIEIPEGELKAILRNTGASRTEEAVLEAIREFNRRRAAARLADRGKGSLPRFMTLRALRRLREDQPSESDLVRSVCGIG